MLLLYQQYFSGFYITYFYCQNLRPIDLYFKYIFGSTFFPFSFISKCKCVSSAISNVAVFPTVAIVCPCVTSSPTVTNSPYHICETGDNKQGVRSRLLEYWFSTYNWKSQFTTMSSSATDSERVVN